MIILYFCDGYFLIKLPPRSLYMTTLERAQAFIQLGRFLTSYLQRVKMDPFDLPDTDTDDSILTRAIHSTLSGNPWFILPNIILSLQSVTDSLAKEDIDSFLQDYATRIKETNHPITVGVIMAGNVPLVGFHDFFCVVLSGNRFMGKLSSEDKYLLPALFRLMARWFPEIKHRVSFVEGILSPFDAIIATGSDNTSRYFEYYFGKYPNIIRKNRNSVAVLNGKETPDELVALGIDIFSHFGRGCRNVSRLFLPENYPVETMHLPWSQFSYVMDHSKYRNNYDYYKSVFIVSNIPYRDNRLILMTEDPAFSPPIAVLNYEYYADISEVNALLHQNQEKIQCIVSKDPVIDMGIPFGKAQKPFLFDFADGINTMDFLIRNGRI